jgi:hypothetical protein
MVKTRTPHKPKHAAPGCGWRVAVKWPHLLRDAGIYQQTSEGLSLLVRVFSLRQTFLPGP